MINSLFSNLVTFSSSSIIENIVIEGQQCAIRLSRLTKKPYDFNGCRYYPPGPDGIPIVGKIPDNEDQKEVA